MTNRISIRLPAQLQQALESLIQATGKSESQIVREALEEYVRQHAQQPSCYDLALKLGLLGCARDLPADLSSNERHMEGFGRG